MYTLGINLSHHSSIALLHNNEVLLFLHEERANRKKYYHGVPYKTLDLIKNYTNTIDAAISISGPPQQLNSIVQYLKDQNVQVVKQLRQNSNHHLAHAAAGFYMSGMDEATIFVIDGAGAIYPLGKEGVMKVSETTSRYQGSFPNIKCTNKHFVIGLYNKPPFKFTNEDKATFRKRFDCSISITLKHDIGWRYATVTDDIGFGVFGEGKTMGLSAYGCLPGADSKSIAAYKIQKELEEHFANLFAGVEGNVVISGGCALNILGNSYIKKLYPRLNIFVDPIAADGTIALGAAAYHFYSHTNCQDKLVTSPYQGPSYSLTKNYINELTRKYSV